MERELLVGLIQENKSQREIAAQLDVSQTTVKYWLSVYKLKTQRKQCNVSSGHSKVICGCGESNLDNFYRNQKGIYFKKCKRCFNQYRIQKFRESRKQIIDYKGGKCEVCGYNKCIAALTLHHTNPSKKDPRWDKIRQWNLEKIKSELDTCELLCNRCHTEKHWAHSSDG